MRHLNSFFARHRKSFLSEFAFAFPVVAVAFLFAALLAAVTGEPIGEPSDPQRYTVHFDGIDYQDLARDYRSAYKTRAGKRIEFHGSFYEVEQ